MLPGRAWPRSSDLLPTAVVLAAIFAAGIATAWGGFLRRNRAALAAGFALLAGYTILHFLVVNMFVREFRFPPGSIAFVGFLWLAAGAGAWGAVSDPSPAPGLRWRGWSRVGAFAALCLSLLALAHLGVVATLPRGDRWVTAEYAAGVIVLASLATAAAVLAWWGLAFRRRGAAIGTVVLLTVHSIILVVAERRFEFRLDQPEPPLWPLLTVLAATWAAVAAGLVASRRMAPG